VKIFDPSPAITLARPRRRRIIIIAVAGIATCLALAAALFYQHKTYSARLNQANRELTASQTEVKQLRTRLASMQGKLGAAVSESRTCASNLDAETSKVAAFAMQAAACARIQAALHVKG
jgi:peptidoglycan hydrolase CwlO-like protein